MREVRPALELADAAMVKAEETAFAYILLYARIVKGWALAEAGKADEGAGQISEAIAGASHAHIRFGDPRRGMRKDDSAPSVTAYRRMVGRLDRHRDRTKLRC